MPDILGIVLTVYVFVGIGYAAGRLNAIEATHSKLFSRFVFYVSLPCLVLAQFGSQNIVGSITPGLLALNILPPLIAVALIFAAVRLVRIDGKLAAMLILAAVMPSSTFVGFPVVDLMFGAEGMATALLVGPMHLFITLLIAAPAVGMLTGGKKEGYAKTIAKILAHPIILAMAAGVALNLANTMLPDFFAKPLSQVGASTVPVALFSIGLFMAGVKLHFEKLPLALLISVFRLAPYGLLLLLIAPALGVSGTPFFVSLLLAMMPVAVLSFVLSLEYGLDAEAMALGIFVTSILLPIPIYIVDYLIG